jgi:hypothetical protein
MNAERWIEIAEKLGIVLSAVVALIRRRRRRRRRITRLKRRRRTTQAQQVHPDIERTNDE